MSYRHKTLEELVHTNHKFGLVLYGKGIYPDDVKHVSLDQICLNNNIDLVQIEAVLCKIVEAEREPHRIPVESLTLDQLIEYLTQTHHEYIRIKLPAIQLYLHELQLKNKSHQKMIHELASVYAKFDFHVREHILFEENEVFPYINALVKIYQTDIINPSFFLKYRDLTLNIIESKHKDDGDEFMDLKYATNDFYISPDFDLLHQIVIKELKLLEKDLETHALIEEDFLFPQAEEMERYVIKKIKQLSHSN
jgi:regulator of cell morphogenesis and NO signaling